LLKKFIKMSKFLRLSKLNHRDYQKITSSQKKKWSFNVRAARLFLAVIVIGMGVFYLVEINQVSTLGFKLRALEEKQGELKVDNEKLEIDVAQMQAMKKIEEKSGELGLTRVTDVKYLEIGSQEVAAK